MGYQDYVAVLSMYLLQMKFTSTGIIFIHWLFVSSEFVSEIILFPGHFLNLSNSRTFPGNGKLICYFPSFSGHVGTLQKAVYLLLWVVHTSSHLNTIIPSIKDYLDYLDSNQTIISSMKWKLFCWNTSQFEHSDLKLFGYWAGRSELLHKHH